MRRQIAAREVFALCAAGGLSPDDVFHIEVDAAEWTVTFGVVMRNSLGELFLAAGEIATKTVIRDITYSEPEYQI